MVKNDKPTNIEKDKTGRNSMNIQWLGLNRSMYAREKMWHV